MFLSRSTHLALQIDRYYLEHHECTQSSGAIFGGATTFRTLLVQFEKIVRFARHGRCTFIDVITSALGAALGASAGAVLTSAFFAFRPL